MATAYRTVFDTQNGTDRQTHTQAELFLFSDDAMENENKYEDGGFFEKKMKKQQENKNAKQDQKDAIKNEILQCLTKIEPTMLKFELGFDDQL